MGCALVVIITLSLKLKLTNGDVNHTFVCWSEVYALMHQDFGVCVWWEGKPLKLSSSSLALWALRELKNWPSLWWALLNRPLTSCFFFPPKLLTQHCSSVSQCPVNRLCSESLILPIKWLFCKVKKSHLSGVTLINPTAVLYACNTGTFLFPTYEWFMK